MKKKNSLQKDVRFFFKSSLDSKALRSSALIPTKRAFLMSRRKPPLVVLNCTRVQVLFCILQSVCDKPPIPVSSSTFHCASLWDYFEVSLGLLRSRAIFKFGFRIIILPGKYDQSEQLT